MIPRKQFIFFLLDTPTGKAYYRDHTGSIQLVNIIAATVPADLKHAPANWLGSSIAFDRNMTYFGINRSYMTPQEFVLEAKDMIQELTLNGVGVETPLSLAIFRYNSMPSAGEPQYKLYYKAPLDLPEANGVLLESLTCNLMEGGVTQLLKNYENTPLSIPCDGSLPEHIKANYDGMLLPEVFHYKFVPYQVLTTYDISPLVFLNNEGDNFGVVHNNSSDELVFPSGDVSGSPNYIFYSTSEIKLRVSGDLTLRTGFNPSGISDIVYSLRTDAGQVVFLAPYPYAYQMQGTGSRRYNFNVEITLAPNEKLYVVQNIVAGGIYDVVDGTLKISFSSKPKDSRVWGLTAYDLWRLIGKQVCQIASTTSFPVNYDFTSELLQQYLNFFMTSGDALRASNDPTYQRYYFVDENNGTRFGPVIKITPKQFYESIRVPLMAAIGRGYSSTGSGDTLFFEVLESVFDSTVTDYSLGEVSKMKYDLHSKDFRFSDISIGYLPQTYDQKAGKYEWNTRLKMKAPIKSFEKPLVLESYIRTDAYGQERLRSGAEIGASTSTTRNDSDNSVFLTVIDRGRFIYDYFKASFQSLVPDPDDSGNTNLVFETQQNFQKLDMPITDGEYFQVNKDWGIFVFSVTGYSATESTVIKMDAIANSVNHSPLQPADFVTVKFWRNGVVVFESTTTITGVNTVIDPTGLGSVGGATFNQLYQYGDCIYITIHTSATAVVMINTVELQIGSYVSMSGSNIPIEGGVSQKLVSMPTVVPPSDPYNGSSRVQYGFQYFQYNSLSFVNNFDIQLLIGGLYESQVATFEFDIFINGIKQAQSITLPGSVTRTTFLIDLNAAINRTFALDDIVFVTGTNSGSSLHVELFSSKLTFTSTQVKAYNLYRVQYDSMKGLPLLVTDDLGNFRTDMAGCPYNIEYVSPARCLERWMPYINSCFPEQVTGDMVFQTLDKNSFLSTTKGTVTFTENANKTLLTQGRLFYPVPVSVDFYCPLTFDETQSKLSNAHVYFTFMDKPFYFHIMHIEQKGALNDTTTATGVLSPLSKPSDLVNLTSFKIPTMKANDIFCAVISPVQFVPIVRSLPDKYHTANRNYFLFSEQIDRWFEKTGYAMPVQIGDFLSLPFITHSLDPVFYTVYNCEDDSIFIGPNNLDTVASPAIVSPYVNWQKQIDTSAWPRGNYYIKISSTASELMISECLEVRPKEEMWDTVLIEARHSQNTQGMVFDGVTPQVLRMRFYGGYDNNFVQKYIGKFYIDQPQDITILNAIPYETTTLYIGGRGGVPDYVSKKILRYLLLDDCKIDGENFSLNDGAEAEVIFSKGAPKKIYKIEIRPSENKYGIVVNSAGIDEDSSMIVSMSPGAFGPNVNNESGTVDGIVNDIIVNP